MAALIAIATLRAIRVSPVFPTHAGLGFMVIMMNYPMTALPIPITIQTSAEAGHPLSDFQIKMIQGFAEAMARHNAVKNLTRIPLEDWDCRHFAESVLMLPFLHGVDVLDIGCGPGFPSFPLAAVRPELNVTAIDSNKKMLDFLITQATENLEVVHGRMEDVGWTEMFTTVTGRAVAPLPIQLEISAKACAVGGYVIPFRTTHDVLEGDFVSALGLELEKVETRELPDGITRVFPMYKKVKPTPEEFPRQWAMIKKHPLG